MSHFMMDCYFPDVTKPGGLACDSLPIKALNEGDAIEEAKRIAIWRSLSGSMCDPSAGAERKRYSLHSWDPPGLNQLAR
jgi:hypothetical protein